MVVRKIALSARVQTGDALLMDPAREMVVEVQVLSLTFGRGQRERAQ
jgi:hypothetical protein